MKKTKILLIIILSLIGIFAFRNKQSKAATETYTETQNGYNITWEFETVAEGSIANNIRIKEIKDSSNNVIVPTPVGDAIHTYDYSVEDKWLGTLTIPGTVTDQNSISYTVKSIGNGTTRIINPVTSDITAPYEKSIKKLVLPASVETINASAFYNCSSIEEIVFGGNEKTIGAKAFTNVLWNYRYKESKYTVTTLNIPDSVETIGDSAFEVIKYNDFGYWIVFSTARYVHIGPNVTSIGNSAFAGTGLLEVTIPDNVTSVGESAFSNNSALKKFTIAPRTTTLTLGNNAFANTGLYSEENNILTVPSDVQLGTGVFQGSGINEITLPSEMTTIPASTFKRCNNLTKVNINQITNINSSAFEGCSSLTTDMYDYLVANATKIGDNAFSGCNSLSGTVEVKSIVTSLGTGVFKNCTGIEKAKISANLTKIPAYTYEGATNLKEIEKTNTITEISYNAFNGCKSITMEKLYSQFLTNISIIGSEAFNNIFTFDEIFYFPASITKIDKRAFFTIREAFFEGNQPTLADHWNGNGDVFVHYNGHKHKITVTNKVPGVTLTNENNSTFATGQYTCKDAKNVKVNIAEGYSYPNLKIKIVSQGRYVGSTLVKRYVTPDENGMFQVNNIVREPSEGIIRDLYITVVKDENETDLTLRQFITKVNGTEVTETRDPNVSTSRNLNNKTEILYRHTKYPVAVEKGDKITAKIRVYNEDDNAGKVDEIRVYLQKGLKLAEGNATNTQYNWTVKETTESGTVISTNYLQNKNIDAYRGEGRTPYQELEYVYEVENEDVMKLITVAEIAKSNNSTSTDNSMSGMDIVAYNSNTKQNQSITSSYSSYIKGTEKDDDFEMVGLKNYIKVGYKIAVEKIDQNDLELLNGAQFNLYDKDNNLLEEKVTGNGGKLEFSERISYGEGIETYYIDEVKTPAGYKKTLDGKLMITVYKTIDTSGRTKVKIVCEASEEVNDGEGEEFIPISTAEQLAKIGSEETITIGEKSYQFAKDANYQLQNDIELGSHPWTPIEKFEGVLDGNNHTIRNLRNDQQTGKAGANGFRYGLFNELKGTVKNLNLVAYITFNVIPDDSDPQLASLCAELAEIETQYQNGQISNYQYNSQKNNKKRQIARIIDKVYVGGIAGYMTAGSIANSTVSGAISINSEYNTNVGGFIGHTAPGEYVKLKNCINNASVVAQENAGGLIGTAKGNVELNSCKNKGDIASKSYEAGGLVGIAVPTGTTPENIIVEYDETNSKITVAVKNKKTNGKYDLNIEKIDEEAVIANYLEGALFNIYDENWNLIKENEEAENGKLTIPNIEINSLRQDIFYVKEVQAPQGYDIAIKDPVKVTINKTWNSNRGKYEISADTEAVEENTPATPREDTTHTGNYSTVRDSEYVVWKKDRFQATNCTNEGTVISTIGQAGGLAGYIEGNIDVYDSQNKGTVRGYCQAGGLVGIIVDRHDQYNNLYREYKANFVRCSNGTKDGDNTECVVTNTNATSATGGLIGLSIIDATFSECSNYSDISALAQVGGIVGKSLITNIDMYNCKNYGKITRMNSSSVAAAGGLIGEHGCKYSQSMPLIGSNGSQSLKSSQPYTGRYVDCESYGSIETNGDSGHIGGIAGSIADLQQTTISNCKIGNNDSEEKMILQSNNRQSSIGGLTGQDLSKILEVRNNKINNVKILSYGMFSSDGGLVGISFEKNAYTITLDNNEIDNSEITIASPNDGNVGGLYGYIYCSNTRTQILVSNNTVKNSKIACATETGSNLNMGGLIGYGYGKSDFKFINCNVIDTDILGTKVGYNYSIGGIIGATQNVGTTTFENCEIKSTGETKHSISQQGNPTTQISIGGFVGWNYLEYTTIRNSRITNMNIFGNNSNVLGGFIGISYYTSGISIVGSEISNSHLKLEGRGNNGKDFGGLIGYAECTVSTENIKFNNNTMDVSHVSGNATNGGLLGYGGTLILQNLEMKNNIINEITPSGSLYGPFGGIIGKGTVSIDDSTIEKLTINAPSSIVCQMAGISGTATTSIRNSKIKDITIIHNIINQSYNNAITAGLVAYGKANIKNTDIENIKIESKDTFTGGLVGLSDEVTLDNLNVKSINVESTKKYASGSSMAGTTSGIIGAAQVATVNNVTAENVTVEGKALSTDNHRTTASSGFIGFALGDVSLTNSILKDSTIKTTVDENVDSKQMHAAGLVGVAGNITIKDVAVLNTQVTDNHVGAVGGILGVATGVARIEDSKVENTSLSGKSSIGGVIGVGRTEMKNATVSNLNAEGKRDTTITDYDVFPRVGGIAGILVEGSEVENVTVNTKANGEEPGTSLIKSEYIAGGIAGVNSGETLKDSKVENVTVQAVASLPGETEEEGRMILVNRAAAVASHFAKEAVNMIITNVRVINGETTQTVNSNNP